MLHDRFDPTDGEDLLKFITITAAEFGISGQVQPMVMSTHKDIYVMIGETRVMVSQNEEPLGQEGFQSALSYPLTEMTVPDAADVVARHKANTFITIGKGAIDQGVVPAELMETFEEVVGEDGKFQTWEEAQAAMNLAGAIAEFITQTNPAAALHWCPSDHLVTPAFFKSICDADSQIPLFMRPHLFSSQGQLGPGIPLGVVAVGSQWLIGKLVTLEEAPVPLDFAIQRLEAFIAICQKKGELIPDGDTFGESEEEVIDVTYVPADVDCPFEQIKLTVRQAPEFGMDQEVPHQVHIHYDDDGEVKNPEALAIIDAARDVPAEDGEQPAVAAKLKTEKLDLDPDDDTDWAIMKALEKRKAELAAEEGATASFASFTAEKAEQTAIEKSEDDTAIAEAEEHSLETMPDDALSREETENITLQAPESATSGDEALTAEVPLAEEASSDLDGDADNGTPVNAERLEPDLPELPEPVQAEDSSLKSDGEEETALDASSLSADGNVPEKTELAVTEEPPSSTPKRSLNISELRKLASAEANRGKSKAHKMQEIVKPDPQVELDPNPGKAPALASDDVPAVELSDIAQEAADSVAKAPKKTSLLSGLFRRKAG